MTGFTGDPLWQQPARSYNVAAFADTDVQAAAAPLLDCIAALAGGRDALLIAPRETLHLSIYSVAPVRSDFDKDAYWAAVRSLAMSVLQDWCAGTTAPRLRFRSLKATPAAVIAVAEPDEAIWALRRAMAAALPPPPGGAPKYDLIHMTLARYARPQQLPADFAAAIAAQPVALDFPVRQVILMKETQYPSLSFETLQTQALRAPEMIA